MPHVLPIAPCPGSSDPALVTALCATCDRRQPGVVGKPLKPSVYWSGWHGEPRCADYIEPIDVRIDRAREAYEALLSERLARRNRVLNPQLLDGESGGTD